MVEPVILGAITGPERGNNVRGRDVKGEKHVNVANTYVKLRKHVSS
jgi:hypothetical protein